MASYPVYKIYSGSTALYLMIDGSIEKPTTKDMTDLPIPFTTERLMVDEITPVQSIKIRSNTSIGSDKIYTTDALLETAINNIIAITGGVYITGGTYDTVSGFTEDTTFAFRATALQGKACLITSLSYRRNSANFGIFEIEVTVEIGTSVF